MSWSKEFLQVTRDYSSDCGYCSCSCECLSSKTTNSSVPQTIISPRVKKYKTVKERNASAGKKESLPVIANIRLSYSVEDLHRNVYPESVELCESMQNLCMSPRVFRAFNSVSTHDQRILNRMAAKRKQRIVGAENAWLAQKMWQNEKYERDLRKYEQEEVFKKTLREKQEMDSKLLQLRMDEILRQDRARLEELKQSLVQKDIQTEQRLEKLRYQRDAKIADQHAKETRKFESILRSLDERLLKDEIQKHNTYHHLEDRLDRAGSTRKHYLNAYKRRLQADNYRQQALHKENYDEALRFENYKREQLQDMLSRKDQKIEKFVEQRRQVYNDSIERARLSSSLRDLVRQSISPDSFQFAGEQTFHERPFSKLSVLSSFRLGY